MPHYRYPVTADKLQHLHHLAAAAATINFSFSTSLTAPTSRYTSSVCTNDEQRVPGRSHVQPTSIVLFSSTHFARKCNISQFI